MSDDGIKEAVETIFSGIIVGSISKSGKNNIMELLRVHKECLPKFKSTFSHNIFEDEYAILYAVVRDLGVSVFDTNQIRALLATNADLVLDSPYVDLTRYDFAGGQQTTDDEKLQAFTEDVVEVVEKLSNRLIIVEEFTSSCVVYIESFRKQFMTETIHNMALIMSDAGFVEREKNRRRTPYKGEAAAERYYAKRRQILKQLSSADVARSVVVNEEWLEKEFEKDKLGEVKPLFFTGIEEIDRVIGGILRTQMLGILGVTKGGKTRVTNHIVALALEAGLNVAVWTVEGTPEEWQSQQVANYLKRKANISMADKVIRLRKYVKDEKMKKRVQSAKTILALGEGRGCLSFISGSAYVEDFIAEIDAHYQDENPFDIIVIDSIVNFSSRTNMEKSKAIGRGYMDLKNYIANQMAVPAAAIVTAQIKQKVIDEILKNPKADLEVTAGGESAETIRSPDEVIGLFSTKAERQAGMTQIMGVASRHSSDIPKFYCSADFKCSHFTSDPKLNQ